MKRRKESDKTEFIFLDFVSSIRISWLNKLETIEKVSKIQYKLLCSLLLPYRRWGPSPSGSSRETPTSLPTTDTENKLAFLKALFINSDNYQNELKIVCLKLTLWPDLLTTIDYCSCQWWSLRAELCEGRGVVRK